jgi:hypothetical protein
LRQFGASAGGCTRSGKRGQDASLRQSADRADGRGARSISGARHKGGCGIRGLCRTVLRSDPGRLRRAVLPNLTGCPDRISCQGIGFDLELKSKRGRQIWWRRRGQAPGSWPGSLTPFILERANSPKGGGAKLWAFSRGLVVARLPKGWTGEEPVRPQVFSWSEGPGGLSLDPGTGSSGYTEACPAFFTPFRAGLAQLATATKCHVMV